MASLYPTNSNIAAKEANGIRFRKTGIIIADNNKIIPWNIADILVFPPELILAELLTITCVIGSPPIIPETIFPIP